MKRLLVLLICLTVVFSMAACDAIATGDVQGIQGEQGLPGKDGKDGKDGETPTVEIDDDGYWVINGVKTEHRADGTNGTNGKDGVNGEDGKNGIDGVTPIIEISEDGYWVINGVKTEYKAVGTDGKDGADGTDGKDGVDGVTPTVEISEDGYWVINGVKTEYKAVGTDGKDGADGSDGKDGVDGEDGIDGVTPTVEISEDGYWVINGVKTEYKAVGTDGKDGADGSDGKDGVDGEDGKDGADGEDGTDGETPYIGENGNWWIGESDTGVYAGGEACDHEYGEWVVFIEPVCTPGFKARECTLCGYTEVKIIPAEHEYVTYEGKEATCNSIGWNEYCICSLCGYTNYVEIPILPHTAEWTVITEATCTEDGYRIYECSSCHLVLDSEVIGALGHLSDGESCERCGLADCTVKVNYIYSDGSVAFESVVLELWEGDSYSVVSKEIDDFVADHPVISGVATSDTEITVTYSPISLQEIVRIDNVTIGSVPYNTAYSELALPSGVTGYTADGRSVSLSVYWDSASYSPTVYGAQTVTGVAVAGYGYVMSCSNAVYAEVEVATNVIASVDPMDLGRLPINTSYAGLGLPTTAAVTTTAGATYYLPVSWNEYEYDPSVAGKHTISGYITLEEGFTFAEGVENSAYISFELSEAMYGTADIVFLVDTTGSMWGEIQNVKNNIVRFAERLEEAGVSVRWALLEYRDITCDGADSTKVIYCGASEWYIDVHTYEKAIASLSVSGGGDRAETIIDALKAATYLESREDASTFYIAVTDADYKTNNNYGVSGMSDMIAELASANTVTSVVTKTSFYDVYRALTDGTNGILANIDGDFASELWRLCDLITEEVIYGDVSYIEIVNAPDKTSYVSGDYFDGAGMIVRAYYENGLSRDVTGYSVNPYGALGVEVTEIEINYRGKTATVAISVELPEISVEGVGVSFDSVELTVGESARAEAYVYPTDATNSGVVWYTGNPNVAVVDDSGLITAIGEGETYVTVVTLDGGYSCEIYVKVNPEPISAEGIYTNVGAIEMVVGDSVTVVATVLPENVTDKSVIWSSSDETVAVVYDGVISAVGAGNATVTVTTVDGGYQARIYVAVSNPAPAYSEGLEYTLSDDGTYYTVTGIGTCTDTDIVIPDTYEGLPVTGIGYEAFRDCSSLTSVTIPDSVTSIGNYAFAWCDSLTSVTIPDSVTSISYAFYSCTNLTNITVNENNERYKSIDGNLYTKDGKTLIQYAVGKTNTEFTIPDSVTYIDYYAFRNCSSLTSITISESVNNIGPAAFSHCSSLINITIPNSVTHIAWSAFSDCSSLTSITIPDSVTSIDDWMFNSCSSLTSITIPDSVTSIGDKAFSGCSSLTSVTIPDSVTSIGIDAFWFCSSLTSVTIGNGVASIGRTAFGGCDSLTSITVDENNEYYQSIDGNLYTKDEKTLVQYAIGKMDTEFVIPASVTSIGYSAFWNCDSLTSVTIPASVTSIGEQAFSNCSSLTSVTIGNSVTSIGNFAFYYCSSLTSVTIPDGVTSIGNSAFYVCNNLAEVYYTGTATDWAAITIGSGNTYLTKATIYYYNEVQPTVEGNFWHYVDGVVTIWPEYVAPAYSEGLEYTLSDDGTYYTVTGIGTCTDTDIVIPDTYEGLPVSGIGDEAFLYCRSLTSVTIPDSVTSIGEGAFSGCSSLTSVTIGNSVTSIGNSAFRYCSSLTSVTIPNSVTSIGESAFLYCYKLVEVINHSSLNITAGSSDNGYVAYYAKEVHTGESKIVNIDNYLFYTYDSVNYLIGYVGEDTELVLPESYNGESYEIYKYAFDKNTNVISVTIPDSVTRIGDYAFSNCSGITSITIPDSVTGIGDGAFFGCSSLVSITIPDSVTSIDWHAFSNCSGLTSVTIGNGVTSIGSFAFEACSALTSITIPDSVTSIGGNAFEACSSLTSITVDENNTAYCDIDGNLYSKDGSTLIQYAIGKKDTSFIIPDSVTSIGNFAFYYCSSLTSVTIPDGVTSIGSAAFHNCSSLTSINIPDSVTSIGNQAFYGCTNLIQVENGVSYVDKWVVDCDTTVETVVLRENTVGIADSAFKACYSLTSVIIPNNVTSIGNYAFEYCSSLISITIPDSVTSIGDFAFYGCSSLTSVTIPDSVTGIGDYAFDGCSSLTSVTIPDSVTSISAGAFYNCSSLTSITIPDSVTSIGDYAFSGCDNLAEVYYTGTATDWAAITIVSSNTYLTNATIYYYSEVEPTGEGNFWHYVDGVVTVW